MRLTASLDPDLWVPVTWPSGAAGGKYRRAAVKLLQKQSNLAWAQAMGGAGRVMAWFVRRMIPRAVHASNGAMLIWSYKPDHHRVAATATVVELTPHVRAARATLPMEYDDTESFPSRLGVGEKLVVSFPEQPSSPPLATYTWETGTHLITLTAVGGSRETFGTLIPALDDLARSIRIAGDLSGGESPDVLRIDPA